MEEAQNTSLANALRLYRISLGTLWSVYAKDLDNRFSDIMKEVKELAFTMTNRNSVEHAFKRNKAGGAWLKCLTTRNLDLLCRTPEPGSVSRCSNHTYNNLCQVMEKYHL